MLRLLTAALLAAGVMAAHVPSADAGEGYRKKYSRSGAKVKGYVARRGGYSYEYSDSINTYGDSRGRYGSALNFRDFNLGRQTEAGPFDHGYFFDSGMGPRGGDSPYMN